MARPRRSDHNRQSILEAGAELLAKQGYHGTGLKQILDAVKVPKGSFYHYFENKEQFVAEVIIYYLQQQLGQLDQVIRQDGSPMTRLKQGYHYALQVLAEKGLDQGCMLGNLAAEVGGQSELCRQTMLTGWQRWQKMLTTLIGQAQAIGEVRSDISAEVLARLFWDRWEGGLLRIKLQQELEGFRQDMDTMVDVLFKG